MIKQVSHPVSGLDPAGLALALEVAYELHAPEGRAPEVVAVPQLMGLRTSAARPHRRRVPLNHLAALRG
ncbi:hypothetical protein [Streptomyces sp. NPDC048419]|uniref:hypothetical protein n=1 Tax=Streptomyces sp. NPDC048419 TaxID=3365547 RepID=UPI003710F98B